MPYTTYLRQQAQTCRQLAHTSEPRDAEPLVELARDYDRWARLFEMRKRKPLSERHGKH